LELLEEMEQWSVLEECPASLKTIAASDSSSTMRKDWCTCTLRIEMQMRQELPPQFQSALGATLELLEEMQEGQVLEAAALEQWPERGALHCGLLQEAQDLMHCILHHSYQCRQKLKVLEQKRALGQRPVLDEMEQGSVLEEGLALEVMVDSEHVLERGPELDEMEQGSVLVEALLTNLNRIPLPNGNAAQLNTSKVTLRLCGLDV
jgi:hypothetical protein